MNHKFDQIHIASLRTEQHLKERFVDQFKMGASIHEVLNQETCDVLEKYEENEELLQQPRTYINIRKLRYRSKTSTQDQSQKDSDDKKSVQKHIEDGSMDIIYAKFRGEIDQEYPVSTFELPNLIIELEIYQI